MTYKVGNAAYPPPFRVIISPTKPPIIPSVIKKIELAEIPSMFNSFPMYFRIKPLIPKAAEAISAIE